ncbi:hypothetical protein CCUS01_14968 [Colletotrichum cuscutae]|uniref:Uncharacterized protein n=1 Tax=Colletotrichum cuscutae TaxID=1209917 RepID=A0AAI9VHB3_9PEZI|nr:hypothetical protein CCUS01_14968 [Colletotrichum cuscutae]
MESGKREVPRAERTTVTVPSGPRTEKFNRHDGQRQASINNTHVHASGAPAPAPAPAPAEGAYQARQRGGGSQALTLRDGMDNPDQGSSKEQGCRRSGGLVGPATMGMDEGCEGLDGCDTDVMPI